MTRIIADISVSLDDTSGAGEVGKPAFVAAERDLDINRDAPDLRRLPVIR